MPALACQFPHEQSLSVLRDLLRCLEMSDGLLREHAQYQVRPAQLSIYVMLLHSYIPAQPMCDLAPFCCAGASLQCQ